MKARKWPFVVGAVVVLLIFLFAIGAATAFQSAGGDGRIATVLGAIGAPVIAAIIVALLLRVIVPRPAKVVPNIAAVQFTIAPLGAFIDSMIAVRWQLGDGTPLPNFGSFSRPLIQTDDSGITIWKSATDARPLATIPAQRVRSVIAEVRAIQVSRVGVTNRMLCIIAELEFGRTSLSLVLPAPTPVNDTVRGNAEDVEFWVEDMRDTLNPGDVFDEVP